MSFTKKVLNKIRYLAYLPLIAIIGLITMPLTLFGWNGFWILCIIIEENCSLTEAKKIYKENSHKYKITFNTEEERFNGDGMNLSTNKISRDNYNDSLASSARYNLITQTCPTYSNLDNNIYHNDYMRSHDNW